MTEKLPNSEKEHKSIVQRIEAVQKYALENRAEVGSYMKLIEPITSDLRQRFSQEDELSFIFSWHKLIGSTPPPHMPEADSAIVAEVDEEITRFVSELEDRWGIDENPEDPEGDIDSRIDALYEHVAETRDFAKNSQFNEERETLRESLLLAYPPADDGSSQLKGIPAWEKLIGGGETETIASSDVIHEVTQRVEELVARLEQEWGIE